MQVLRDERLSLDSQKSMKEEMVSRLKQEKRTLVQTNESSQKMHREKIEKLQADLALKTDEVKKLKARITSMRN